MRQPCPRARRGTGDLELRSSSSASPPRLFYLRVRRTGYPESIRVMADGASSPSHAHILKHRPAPTLHAASPRPSCLGRCGSITHLDYVIDFQRRAGYLVRAPAAPDRRRSWQHAPAAAPTLPPEVDTSVPSAMPSQPIPGIIATPSLVSAPSIEPRYAILTRSCQRRHHSSA